MRDDKLLEEYRKTRSDEAFAKIVARYLIPVFSTCLRETGDRSTAEDLTQAVFLLLARKAPSLNPNVSLSGWLFHAARLVSRNALREERRRRVREQKAALMQTPSSTASWDAVDSGLNDALAALNAGDRLAILRRYFDGLEISEIAQELGVSTGAAQMRVSRALDRLRAVLAKQGAVVPSVTLAAMLASGAVKPAHADLTGKIVQNSAATGAGTTAIVEAVMKQMRLAQLKFAVGISACVLGIGAAGSYSYHNIAYAAPAAKFRSQGKILVTPAATKPQAMARYASLGPQGLNTYHLVGGSYLNGKIVPWEIWGRRKPYFYYERTGEAVTQDNGGSRVEVFAPSVSFNRRASVAFTNLPSQAYGDSDYADERGVTPYQIAMANEWPILTNPLSWSDSLSQNNIKPTAQTPDELIFSITNAERQRIYMLNAGSSTLREYQYFEKTSKGEKIDITHAAISYGEEIPASILQPIDLTQIKTYDPQTLGTVSAAIRPLAIDHSGNILLAATAPQTPLVQPTIVCADNLNVTCRDSSGGESEIPYLCVYRDMTPAATVKFLFTPATPLPAGVHPVAIAPPTDADKSTPFSIAYDICDTIAPPITVHGHTSSDMEFEAPVTNKLLTSRIDLLGAKNSIDPYVTGMKGDLAGGDFHAKLAKRIAEVRANYHTRQAQAQ